jgi:hypothetical protein
MLVKKKGRFFLFTYTKRRARKKESQREKKRYEKKGNEIVA